MVGGNDEDEIFTGFLDLLFSFYVQLTVKTRSVVVYVLHCCARVNFQNLRVRRSVRLYEKLTYGWEKINQKTSLPQLCSD